MIWNPFKIKISSCLGVDIGTNILKVTELKREGERLRLMNYALATPTGADKTFKTSELNIRELANLIGQLLSEAKIKTKYAVFSLPTVSSFSVLINLPPMPEGEFAAAIPFEVKKYIPIPMEEVTLDWSVVKKPSKTDKDGGVEQKTEGAQVLVVAVPKELVNKYVQIGKMAGLNMLTLEHESFSLARSLVGSDSGLYLIIDIGSRGVSLTVVDGSFVVLNHNLEKDDQAAVCAEIRKVVGLYKMRYNKSIKHCLLAGNVGNGEQTLNLSACLADMEIVIGNPFAKLSYSAKLDMPLKEIGPSLAVSVGLAMREI